MSKNYTNTGTWLSNIIFGYRRLNYTSVPVIKFMYLVSYKVELEKKDCFTTCTYMTSKHIPDQIVHGTEQCVLRENTCCLFNF